MLIYKARTKPVELQILEALSLRMTFSYLEKLQLENLSKGHEGDLHFDEQLAQAGFEGIVLNDLQLQENGAFQLDSLLLTGDRMILYDMKNHEGTYFYQDEEFYSKTKKEVNNPLVQWKRHNSLLRQLTGKLGHRYPLESYVLVTNPTFSSLKKGISCERCTSFRMVEQGHACVCLTCGKRERKSQAIMRTIQQFQLLFPKKKLTTAVIHEWCAIIYSPQTIRLLLKRTFQSRGSNKGGYYERF